MIQDSLESLLSKAEKIIDANKDSTLSAPDCLELAKLCQTLNELQQNLERHTLWKQQEQLEAFANHIPAAAAILDTQMCYLSVSDRWLEYFQLEGQNIIGQNHYQVFPHIRDNWRQEDRDCLAGKTKLIIREDEYFLSSNRQIGDSYWKISAWNDLTGKIGGLLISIETATEKQLLKKKIASCEAQMRSIFAGMNELVFTVDRSHTILFLPTKFFEIYSDSMVNQIVEQTYIQLFERDRTEDWRNLIDRVLQTQTAIEFEYSLQLENCLVWYSAKVSPTSPTSSIWVARDITERKENEQNNLFIEKELAHVTLQSIGEGVIRTDALGQIQYINPVAEKLTGWQKEDAKDNFFSTVFHIVDRATQKPALDPIKQVKHKNKIYRLTDKNVLIDRHNNKYAIEGVASPIKNRQNKLCGVAIVFRDVSQAQEIAQKLSWQASHDSLTKLYNRHKFEEEAIKAIESAKNNNFHHVLCYLDLDRFKIVNDTCGHRAGDELLRQVTQLLQQRIRILDIFARLGGDEFALLLHRCSIGQAKKTANLLVEIVREFRFIWEKKVFRIGISIGLVKIDSQTESLNSLLNAADASCYAAKEEGGSTIHVYRQENLALVKQQTQKHWVEKINRALDENSFCLYEQKIVSINGNKQFHYEVLLRLIDETGKLVYPGSFLPAAERYGLMPAIDRWVVKTFLANYEIYCRSQSKKSKPVGNLYTINLSGASINSREFSRFLQAQFERYDVPRQTICFEITETVAITNIDRAIAFINRLKQLGCSIALDDFGSGMSSFNYLKHLPVDYLKIDGSFVKNIVGDRVDYATVECFNHISQIMKIKTIAEFVENEAILKSLKEIGIDYAQGYGIEKPQPSIWSDSKEI